MTDEDLLFVDYDIDTRPEDIRYSHHALPNGELVYASNPSVSIYEFTQAELNDHKILFKHIGAAFGRIMLWVSDGQYYASTEVLTLLMYVLIRQDFVDPAVHLSIAGGLF